MVALQRGHTKQIHTCVCCAHIFFVGTCFLSVSCHFARLHSSCSLSHHTRHHLRAAPRPLFPSGSEIVLCFLSSFCPALLRSLLYQRGKHQTRYSDARLDWRHPLHRDARGCVWPSSDLHPSRRQTNTPGPPDAPPGRPTSRPLHPVFLFQERQ